MKKKINEICIEKYSEIEVTKDCFVESLDTKMEESNWVQVALVVLLYIVVIAGIAYAGYCIYKGYKLSISIQINYPSFGKGTFICGR